MKLIFSLVVALVLLGSASNLVADTTYVTCAASVVNWFGDQAGCSNMNQLSNSDAYTNDPRITGYAYANLTSGTLGILSSANLPTNYGPIAHDFVYAFMGDTVTATGSTAGLNLGVNLKVNGSTTYSDPSQNETFIAVWAFTPGTFDTPDWTVPSQVLFSEGFTLGAGTADYRSDFASYGINDYGGNYCNPSCTGATIPIDIPFSSLESNFQILVALESYEQGDASTGGTWTTDFSHTLDVSLSAPAGVTLTTDSGGLLASSVPEPSAIILLGTNVLLVGFGVRGLRSR